MLLALAALAEGREVVVSRGELIEIGDGFRIPDVLARSGARLVEVGTTNRTRAADYERAIGPDTASPAPRPPVELPRRRLHRAAAARRARGRRPPPRPAPPRRPRLRARSSTSRASRRRRRSLAAGADLVCFSGDKLLGGPAGGDRRRPRRPGREAAPASAPPRPALGQADARGAGGNARALPRPAGGDPGAADAARAGRGRSPPGRAARRATGGAVEETVARVGGGALPLAELPSFACAVEEELAAALRVHEPPVIAVVRDGRTLLDCRTLTDAEADEVAEGVATCRSR